MKITRCLVERSIYFIILLGLVVGSLCILKSDDYLRSYLEGFIQDKFTVGNDDDENVEYTGDYDVILCSFSDVGKELRSQLPILLDTVLAHHPLAVGIDVILQGIRPDEDSLLFSLIQEHDNVVVGYDLNKEIAKDYPRSKVYPFGLDYSDFQNIGYFNFGAKGTEARYLEQYRRYKGPDNKYKGDKRTAMWARLWEIAHGIPSGGLNSNRRFINYSFQPSMVAASIPLEQEMSPDDYDSSFRDRIVIIGNESMDDMMPTPVLNDGKHYSMPGVKVVGYATATIGRNELESNWFDRNRGWIITILCLVFTCFFAFAHFSKKRFWERGRKYSNLVQFLSALALFWIAKLFIPPTGDEWWTFFAVLALFVLFAPLSGDLLKLFIGFIYKK